MTQSGAANKVIIFNMNYVFAFPLKISLEESRYCCILRYSWHSVYQ